MNRKDLKILYAYQNDYDKDMYIIEVKRLDLSSDSPCDKVYNWFWIYSKDLIFKLNFVDGGRLVSGKEVRFLECDKFISDGDGPWIFHFDNKKLKIYRALWDPHSGKNISIEPHKIPDTIIDGIIKELEQ